MSAERQDFESFVAARRAALLRTAYLLTGSREDADDLVQVSLVQVVPHWRRIADDPEPYVRTVLARESVSRWRRRRWREVGVERLPEAAPAGGDVGARVAEREDLRRALLSIAPRQRAVIVLRYFDDLTEQQTADTLGIAVGTVKSQARDALAALRRLLPDARLDDATSAEHTAPAPEGARDAGAGEMRQAGREVRRPAWRRR